MFYFIIAILILILSIFIYFKMKHLKIGCVTFVTGGIKTGKSSLCVKLALKQYRKNLFKVRFKNFINCFLHKELLELPLLYSNIPLNVDYVDLTDDILLRKKRMRYRSVVLISEASLVANSMLFRDKDINNNLSLFFKLFGHETLSGNCFIDTQCVADVHYAIKRVMNNYLHITHAIKLPFFVLLKVREMLYSDDGNSVNVFNTDIEDNVLWLFYPKSIWKKFDAHTFSASTDKLPVSSDVIYMPEIHKVFKLERSSLKTYKLHSFNKDYIEYYDKGVNYETEND